MRALTWRTRARGWREALALRLIGDTPIMANIRLDRADAVGADGHILAVRVDLGEAYHATQAVWPVDALLAGVAAASMRALLHEATVYVTVDRDSLHECHATPGTGEIDIRDEGNAWAAARIADMDDWLRRVRAVLAETEAGHA